jgi:peptidoglycan/xylan/chitin deacetylase (PgdA/CDA1 family)/GT2 family glycosyltransferase
VSSFIKNTDKPIFYSESGLRWRLFLFVALVLIGSVGSMAWVFSARILGEGRVDRVFDMTAAALAEQFEAHDPEGRAAMLLDVADNGATAIGGPLLPARIGEALPLAVPPAALPASVIAAFEFKAGDSARRRPAPSLASGSDGHGAGNIHAIWSRPSQAALATVKSELSHIDVLHPAWLRLDAVDRPLQTAMGAEERASLAHIRREKPSARIVPLLAPWDGALLAGRLADASERRSIATDIAAALVAEGLDGVLIDFQSLPATSLADYRALVAELGKLLDRDRHALMLKLPLGGDAGIVGLASLADTIVLDAFGAPAAAGGGPTAPLDWLATEARRWLAALPAERLVFNLAGHASLWWQGAGTSERLAFDEALVLAQSVGASEMFDPAARVGRFDFRAEDGDSATVWLQDAATLFNQLAVLEGAGARRIGIDTVGDGDPQAWGLLAALSSRGEISSHAAETLNFPPVPEVRGGGELAWLAGERSAGARLVTHRRDDGLVSDVRVARYPGRQTLFNYEARADKKIVLSFDDGPSPHNTQPILDILAEKNVPAVFFVIGDAVLRHPEGLRRIIGAGHEVGNHTFSHVSMADISTEQFRLELNSTQELIESAGGIHTRLFRPPYLINREPPSPIKQANFAALLEAGYISVHAYIDSVDWAVDSPRRIADRTLAAIRSGEGHMLLMHDGGGPRGMTIAALPDIIDRARAEGYQFVSMAEYFGVPREALNRPVGADTHPLYRMALTPMAGAYHWAGGVFFAIIGVTMIIGIGRMVVVLALSAFARPQRRLKLPSPAPLVSVIVPAYNEEAVILATLRSLLASDYTNLEIIVVDDGSKDRTFALVNQHYAGHPKVTAITKPNGGKASALNLGIARASGDYFIGLDADTQFRADTMSWLIAGFTDDKIAAVAGNAKVGNRHTILTKCQAIEYITSQNLDKRGFEVINAITVVPGCVGAWRRSAVIEVEGYCDRTLAEDADLTVRILCAGYRIVYEPRAVALTEAPATLKDFMKQRFRWSFGTLQVIWKNKGLLITSPNKAVGWLVMPQMVLFQLTLPFLAPLLDIALIWALTTGLWHMGMNPGHAMPAHNLMMIQSWLLYTVLDGLYGLAAYVDEWKEDKKLMLLLPVQRLFYRHLLNFALIKAITLAVRGRMVGWGTLKREGSVALTN